jgi:hypothetical protein
MAHDCDDYHDGECSACCRRFSPCAVCQIRNRIALTTQAEATY